MWREVLLKLKKEFNTAHSNSVVRQNFLVRVEGGDKIGMGEAGLPPKKINCYLADVNDCNRFMKTLR